MQTVAVIFGGQSTEHDVSIVTAIASVIKPLELTKDYKVEAVYIAKDGSWHWDDKLKDIQLYQSGEIEEFIKKAPKTHLLFDSGLTLVKSSQFAGRKMYKKIDVVFPAMHGTHGEDGDLMGLLEMANVPYVGCGVEASAIAMDKVNAKLITEAHKIPSSKFQFFDSSMITKDASSVLKAITEKLKFPLFVKPAHLGSSIGISKVEKKEELMNALEVAAHYDNKVIIEEAVQNLIEVTLPIIGNEEPILAHLERPLTKPEDFFDFDAKYLGDGKKMGGKTSERGAQGYSEIPAKISKELEDKAKQLGKDVYKALGCSGIARVDMLINSQSGEVFFNEVNPMPGSLYAHNWRLSGISSLDLVRKLIDYAMARHAAKSKLTTSYNTNFLKQF